LIGSEVDDSLLAILASMEIGDDGCADWPTRAGIDAVLDLNWLRGELASHYSHTGSPSVDPELMVRMLLVGYCYSIRSERRLCQEVKVNLAYRWFCGLGLEDKVPHHSTFSVNRLGRFRDSDILRKVFEHSAQGV
jgi:transposase